MRINVDKLNKSLEFIRPDISGDVCKVILSSLEPECKEHGPIVDACVNCIDKPDECEHECSYQQGKTEVTPHYCTHEPTNTSRLEDKEYASPKHTIKDIKNILAVNTQQDHISIRTQDIHTMLALITTKDQEIERLRGALEEIAKGEPCGEVCSMTRAKSALTNKKL